VPDILNSIMLSYSRLKKYMKNARTAKIWLLHTFILADRQQAFTSLRYNR